MKLNQCCFLILLFLAIAGDWACSTAPTPANSNSNKIVVIATNSNVVTATAANMAATPTASASPTAVPTAGNPSATVGAYYQSMVKKDEKSFRQTLSKATLNEFSADANAEGEKNLVGYWTGYSSPPKQAYETRNERISGDTALLEIKDSDTGKWSLTRLVRENGEWKLDLTSATTESLLKQQPKQ